MSKIGTAHVEIKPVLNEDAMAAITDAISEAVARGVREGMAAATADKALTSTVHIESGAFTFPTSPDNRLAR